MVTFLNKLVAHVGFIIVQGRVAGWEKNGVCVWGVVVYTLTRFQMVPISFEGVFLGKISGGKADKEE